MTKISSDTAKREESHAKVVKLEASIETEMAKVSNQKLQQDVKIENLMKRINDLEENIPDEKEAMEEIKELKTLIVSEFSWIEELKESIALMMVRNTKLVASESETELKSDNFYYEEIKLETEEQWMHRT